MFKRLGEAHPNAVVCLTAQYRMNADIMSVSNALIYEHRLKCGNRAVAEARLSYLRSTQLIDLLPFTQMAWLHHCLAPENSVVFINTDSMRNKDTLSTSERPPLACFTAHDGREREFQSTNPSRSLQNEQQEVVSADEKRDASGGGDIKRGALHNPTEISIITLLVEAFAICGLTDLESAVGIVSPYRAQVRSIQRSLLAMSSSSCSCCYIDKSGGSGVARGGLSLTPGALAALAEHGVSTVDKYQGRDMEVIILSLVRSNDRGQVRGLGEQDRHYPTHTCMHTFMHTHTHTYIPGTRAHMPAIVVINLFFVA
jgi:superfamily I DNA and/or RNA helicase